MRQLLISLFFISIFSSAILAQVEVSSRLQEALNNANPNDYIRTLVLLRDQVDINALDEKLYSENASLKHRAFEVITALQKKAETTQANILSYIQDKYSEGNVFSYKSFWISNLIMVEGKPSVINEIMNRMDVVQMDLDALLQIDYPVERTDQFDNPESLEPGIKIINADKLWALGITGAGRIVMNIDTGVQLSHPALQFKWRGNHVPHNQAWIDPQGGTTTPNDCDIHGSHTMGTMTGWSPTTGDTVGVAPDAEWIAAKTICTSPHTSYSIQAFQWAMDPDGNPGTISDMPDVISNSWYDPDVTNECSGIYKTTLDAVEAAGIAVVFSAGNNGPGSQTITKPKNINTDEVNVFCVGAIDGAAYIGGNTNPIASFSSRGPSTCGGTGSLLIKPEVSAPGVSVRSCNSSSGYSLLSGTSMASPHVAGAIALLKQFVPNLTGKQIKLALYNTAKDLGTAGEDNTYGKGLIDVFAAFLSLGIPDTTSPTQIGDLVIINPTSNSLTLQWTAPSDSSPSGVVGYDVRWALTPITDTIAFNNATPLTFEGLPDTAGAIESMLVEGLDFNTLYYFAIRSKDVWGNWSDISNSAGGNTLFAPQINANPTSLSKVLAPNQVVVDTVVLSNISSNPSTLDYSISLENNTFPSSSLNLKVIPLARETESGTDISNKDNPKDIGGITIDGQGGPDIFGYKWIDSNEPGGPAYVWNDISGTGTAVTNWIATGTFDPKDEGYAGPFNLGFNFKFYGVVKNQIYISSNGLLMFNTVSQNIYTNASIPSASIPNEIICPFWDDLDGRTQGTVHYKQEGTNFIVQFTNWQKYSGTGSLTFQIVLSANGKILIYYNNMNATLTSATVGIENAAGNDGLQVAYNSAYVQNNLALQFASEPDWLSNNNSSGRIYNGNSVAVELTFRSEDYPFGNYSMDMVVTSNDPANSSIIIPVTMELAIPVELTSLTADVVRNQVSIKWITATETNNSGFTIQRSIKGTDSWNDAGFVQGKGTSTEISYYQFADKNLIPGKYLYRLKQIDYDGTINYTNSIEVEVSNPKEYALYQNYPNPFNPSTVIEYSLPENADVTISIYSSLGELITTLVNNAVEAGYQKVSFDASQLPTGTYLYQIKAVGQSKTFIETKKMLLIK
ncbi:MAG: S8 family serine peptidase [Ignavibacteriaceae bacterium]|nr:S8 family serine peptidase [Ignavibacteriaceae bacterium]